MDDHEKEKNRKALQEVWDLEIKASDIIERPAIILAIGDRIIGTEGNTTLIIGKAKSRKTFAVSMAVAAAVSKEGFNAPFKCSLNPERNKVLYFDTEQSNWHVSLVLDRICKQSNIERPDNLHVFALRSIGTKDRFKKIETAVNLIEGVGLVIVDGAKDLVTSINDEDQANMLSDAFLKWTAEKNLHLVSILHENKGNNNARGHLGTELQNKAETVITVTKDDKNKDISIVEPSFARNREFDLFGFFIDDFGIPQIADSSHLISATTSRKFTPHLDLCDSDKAKIIREAYGEFNYLTRAELLLAIPASLEMNNKPEVGQNKIRDFITDLKKLGMISQEKDKAPYKLDLQDASDGEWYHIGENE